MKYQTVEPVLEKRPYKEADHGQASKFQWRNGKRYHRLVHEIADQRHINNRNNRHVHPRKIIQERILEHLRALVLVVLELLFGHVANLGEDRIGTSVTPARIFAAQN